jgi:hypothetical protein
MNHILRIALMSAAFFSYARIAQSATEPADVLNVESANGVVTMTLTFHAEDILSGDGNRCEIYKALIKRAFEQAKKCADKHVKAMEAESEAEEKAAKKAKTPKSEPIKGADGMGKGDAIPIDPNVKLR